MVAIVKFLFIIQNNRLSWSYKARIFTAHSGAPSTGAWVYLLLIGYAREYSCDRWWCINRMFIVSPGMYSSQMCLVSSAQYWTFISLKNMIGYRQVKETRCSSFLWHKHFVSSEFCILLFSILLTVNIFIFTTWLILTPFPIGYSDQLSIMNKCPQKPQK